MLAVVPTGSPTPATGVVIAVVVILALVISINAAWEALKGPPNP